MIVKVNKEKRIGQVIYVVEGEVKEFTLLKHIFTNIFKFNLIEAKSINNVRDVYVNDKDNNSIVTIIKAKTSNINSVDSAYEYILETYSALFFEHGIEPSNAAIYYLFDRDPQSNNNPGVFIDLINRFGNSRDNGFEANGMLLISYPAIESYITNCFESPNDTKQDIGKMNLKQYLNSKGFQQNQITVNHIMHAANKLLNELAQLGLPYKEEMLDNFSLVNKRLFGHEEKQYKEKEMYLFLSLLSISFFDLGLLEANY